MKSSPAGPRSEPALRRAYFDCRHGQLHAYLAIPAGGGFDERTAVLCVPGSSGSGRVFQSLLGLLGRDRSVYAVDLPGCGMSDAPRSGGGVEAQTSGVLDLITDLRLRRVNVLAHEEGSAVALLLAARAQTLIGSIAVWGSPQPNSAGTGGRAVVYVGNAGEAAALLEPLTRAFND